MDQMDLLADLDVVPRNEENQPQVEIEEEGGPTIFDMISANDWAAVEAIIESSPTEANREDPSTGRSPLHMICAFGSSPAHLIGITAAAAPDQIKARDRVYVDTPLHIVCRNSQRTRSKAEILLEYCSPDDVLRRNMIGGTCLHAACGHNAMFPVIEAIVRKNPAVLKISTFDGIPPIRGLFFTYTQSIPGSLAVANSLIGRVVTEGHFDRFWVKAYFLALEYYKLTTACPENKEGITNEYMVHALIHYNAPLNLVTIALKRDVTCAAALDRHGNTPLHLLVERRPYRLDEKKALQVVLETYPEAAALANHAGHSPLILAIHSKIPFEKGVGEILKADMTVLSRRDRESGLFPFQLAATSRGPEALNTTFQLLSALPQVIGF